MHAAKCIESLALHEASWVLQTETVPAIMELIGANNYVNYDYFNAHLEGEV